MIWQAALFSRFIFKKANKNFELKQISILQWVSERFEKREGAQGSLDGEVRLLGLSLCMRLSGKAFTQSLRKLGIHGRARGTGAARPC
jgi:hypothetical protein